jgi:hypothetical protein
MATNSSNAHQPANRGEILAPVTLTQVREYTDHQVMEFLDCASVFDDIDPSLRTAFENLHFGGRNLIKKCYNNDYLKKVIPFHLAQEISFVVRKLYAEAGARIVLSSSKCLC